MGACSGPGRPTARTAGAAQQFEQVRADPGSSAAQLRSANGDVGAGFGQSVKSVQVVVPMVTQESSYEVLINNCVDLKIPRWTT
eukprot:266107-Chlamydomonas_euryale.AAC.1